MKIVHKFWPILLMLFIAALYFKPEFEGKVILGSDSSQGIAKNEGHVSYTRKTGEDYLWNPGIFSGMDMLHGAVTKYNFYQNANFISRLFTSRGTFIFFICLILSYYLGRVMGFSKILSLILAFSLTFSLSNILLYKVGHFSKVTTLIFTPLILTGLYSLFEKRHYYKGGIIIAIGVGFSVFFRHPQMNYYVLLIILPYIIIRFVQFIIQKDIKHVGKIVAFGSFALLLGIGSNFDRLWNLKTHSDVSMRGKKILSQENNKKNKPEKSLSWDYAMAWSNTTPDIIATIIPGYAGGSGSESISKDSKLAKKYGMKQAPLYWGGLPFTEAPTYLGVILIFLLFLALGFNRSAWVWGIFIGIVFSYLLSFGKNIEWLQRFLFNNLPLYDKFRAPSSILNATSYFIPLLAIGSLFQLKKLKEDGVSPKRILWITSFMITSILIFMAVLPDFFELTSPNDQRYVQQGLNQFDLLEARKELIISDSFRSIILILITSTTIYYYFKDKIKYNSMILGILALISFDFISINNRYYNFNDYQSKLETEAAPPLRESDRKILSLESNREDYRVLDLSINTFNTTSSSFYHNTIGGYSPVKYQRYQDLFDRYLSRMNFSVLNMLNTKYIIDQQGKLQLNNQANGTCWFVDDYILVNNPNQEIDKLENLRTENTAVFHEAEFGNYLENFSIDNNRVREIKMISYTPDKIEYKSVTTSDQLAIFSEVWMDGNQWKVFIDNEEVPLLRANYILRALRIPSGEHSIVFQFIPKSFYSGGTITLIFGLIILGILILLLFPYLKSKKLQKNEKKLYD